MQCVHPIWIKNPKYPHGPSQILVPCGRCLPCRILKNKEWTVRLMCELEYWKSAVFLTLTYDDEHLPASRSLVRRDLQLFFKRLRKSLDGKKIKYFACGEYGERFERPHYHAIVYGLSATDVQLVSDCWSLGFVKVGSVTPASVRYVSGYVLKKMFGQTAEQVYTAQGRIPPYLVCSQGLGKQYLIDNFDRLDSDGYISLFAKKYGLPKSWKLLLDRTIPEIRDLRERTFARIASFLRDHGYEFESDDDAQFVSYRTAPERELNIEKRLSVYDRKQSL